MQMNTDPQKDFTHKTNFKCGVQRKLSRYFKRYFARSFCDRSIFGVFPKQFSFGFVAWDDTQLNQSAIVVLVNIGSLLYALVNVFHPDWLIRSNFRLRRSDNLHRFSPKLVDISTSNKNEYRFCARLAKDLTDSSNLYKCRYLVLSCKRYTYEAILGLHLTSRRPCWCTEQ